MIIKIIPWKSEILQNGKVQAFYLERRTYFEIMLLACNNYWKLIYQYTIVVLDGTERLLLTYIYQ